VKYLLKKVNWELRKMESTNFINFWPSDVSHLIFQHLTGKDITKASEVHPSWENLLTNESPTLWQNVAVNINTVSDVRDLTRSKRQYRHAKAVRRTSPSKLFRFICHPKLQWKTVSLPMSVFPGYQTYEKFLREKHKGTEVIYVEEPPEDDRETHICNLPSLIFELFQIKEVFFFDDEPGSCKPKKVEVGKVMMEYVDLRSQKDIFMMNLMLTIERAKKINLNRCKVFIKNLENFPKPNEASTYPENCVMKTKAIRTIEDAAALLLHMLAICLSTNTPVRTSINRKLFNTDCSMFSLNIDVLMSMVTKFISLLEG